MVSLETHNFPETILKHFCPLVSFIALLIRFSKQSIYFYLEFWKVVDDNFPHNVICHGSVIMDDTVTRKRCLVSSSSSLK